MFWIFKISYKFHKIYLNIIRNRIFNDNYLFLLKEIFIDPGTIIIIDEIKIIKKYKKLTISISKSLSNFNIKKFYILRFYEKNIF